MISGCQVYHYPLTYHVKGTLQDDDGGPIARARVLLSIPPGEDPDKEHPASPRFGITDGNGAFEMVVGQSSDQTSTFLMGCIPLTPIRPPIPPNLKEVILYVRYMDAWRKAPVALLAENYVAKKPGNSWIDVGSVRLADG